LQSGPILGFVGQVDIDRQSFGGRLAYIPWQRFSQEREERHRVFIRLALKVGLATECDEGVGDHFP
jgi:hypothetical protein